MKKDSKKDSAVSPVIGTILLVAITVVLVAIISAVVMGMTGNVGQTYVVGVKVTTGNDDGKGLVNVSFTGGDYAKVSSFKVTKDGTATTPEEVEEIPTLGTVYSFECTDAVAGIVNVIAKFSDGSEQIIYDQYLGF